MGRRTTSRAALCFGFLLLTAAGAHAQLKDDAGVMTISDYPALATQVQPEQVATIRVYARNVVISASTALDVLVEVVGHADFDSRGRAFEHSVSETRAENAATILRTAILAEIAQASDPIRLQNRIRIIKVPVGTRFPVFPQPKNEQERRRNRRVEFVHNITP